MKEGNHNSEDTIISDTPEGMDSVKEGNHNSEDTTISDTPEGMDSVNEGNHNSEGTASATVQEDTDEEDDDEHVSTNFEINGLIKKSLNKTQKKISDYQTIREQIDNMQPSQILMSSHDYKKLMVEFCSLLTEIQDFTMKGIARINKVSQDHVIALMRKHCEQHTGHTFHTEVEIAKKTGMVRANNQYREEYLHLGSKKK